MYVLFLFLMVEGGGYSEMKFKLWSRFLEDLAILDNNTDYRTWEMTEWNYQKRYIYWYMFYLSDKRWQINFKMKIKVFVAHRKETYRVYS